MASQSTAQAVKMLATQSVARFASGVHTSTSSRRLSSSSTAAAVNVPPSNTPLIGLPTLANVPVKLNSTKWAAPKAADATAMSIFDVRAAISTLSAPPDPSTLTPGMAALNARVARAQQQQATIGGLKLFPDLTPGRALMWGTILAVWGVSSITLLTARALDIRSVKDIRGKMKETLEPVKEWSRARLSFIPEAFAVQNRESIADAHAFGSSVNRSLRSRDASDGAWHAEGRTSVLFGSALYGASAQ